MITEIDALTLPSAGAADLLAAIKTQLTGAKLRLTKAAVPIIPGVTEASLVGQEATFTGYAAAVLTWSAVGTSQDGNAFIVSDRKLFQPSDAVTPNTIFNAWIESAAGPPGVLEYAVLLPNPVPLPDAVHAVAITATIQYGPGGIQCYLVLEY